jgi:hypothetical protein
MAVFLLFPKQQKDIFGKFARSLQAVSATVIKNSALSIDLSTNENCLKNHFADTEKAEF